MTTQRLLLRPLDISDAAAMQALFPQWEIVKYLAEHRSWPYPASGALTFLRDIALPAMNAGTVITRDEWRQHCAGTPGAQART